MINLAASGNSTAPEKMGEAGNARGTLRLAPRLNPATAYLINRDLIVDGRAFGPKPWIISRARTNPDARCRFVKIRSS